MKLRTRLPALLLACGAVVASAQEGGGLQHMLPGAGLLAETVQNAATNKIEITGEQAFTEQEIRAPQTEEIRDIMEKGVTPAKADDLAFYIGSFYRKAGYSKVAVDYEIHGDKLLIKINEGPHSALHKLIFTGNHVVDEATLYDYMIGATPDQLARQPAKFPFTSAEISAGVDRVRGLYLSKGYLNVAIDSSKVQLSPDGKEADVTVSINEGAALAVGEVTFTGETLYPRDQLITALGESTTGPFAPGLAAVMQRNLQSFYKAHGYYHAEVTVSADSATAHGGRVPMAFHVLPKGLFRFGSVTVKNETDRPRLHADFLPKRFTSLNGQVYDPAKLDETFREMLRTGLFDNLRVSLDPTPANDLTINLTANEAKSKEVGFTIGAGSYEGISIGVRLADRDLFGSGRPITFSADYSQRGIKGELLYTDPWLLDSRFALRSRIYSEARDEKGYSKNGLGVRTDVTRKFMPHLELGVFAEAANKTVTANGIDETLLGPLEYTTVSVGLTQNSDFRNDPINPARGFVFNSSFSVFAVDGETYSQSIARFSYYLPLGKTMLAFGARGGFISADIDRIPIDSRFFNGGSNTVRSFSERDLGPKDHGNPIGGNIFTVFNIEYTFPLFGALNGATFIDAGSLKNDDVPGSSDLRYGVGVGLRYKLPIGPVRLDYGVNPNRRDGEPFGAVNFSFGFAF
ncbi:MAG: BamA/TamA family outer membrane protein [Chthoniobacter sp.]|uniref:BamA/OMP85 family outer membrane protein n=1 Tax=Chthoniobacter sp. TaxID=2510640 RepID=UPI0032AC3D77